METTRHGWVKLHALAVTILVMWERIAQQGSRHLNLNLTKAKKKVENIKNEMNKTWTKKDTESTSNGEGITSSNGSSGHTSSN